MDGAVERRNDEFLETGILHPVERKFVEYSQSSYMTTVIIYDYLSDSFCGLVLVLLFWVYQQTEGKRAEKPGMRES